VTVPADDEDAATAVLWEQGTLGIEVRGEGRGDVALLAYFPDAPGLQPALAAALVPLPRARLQRAEVPDVDWVARFREGFRAFDAAGFLVTPPWGDRSSAPHPSSGPSRPHVTLIVDPGRAFGTGTHESTRLCLGLLRELAKRGPLGRVLDLGTGSGILAVAAARLGARAATALDLDPEAVAAARHHARLNAVELRLVRADLAAALMPGAFDLVLANIAAPLLVERREEILALAAPVMVLSGLLATDAETVRAAYARAGRIEVRRDGEWAALLVEAGAQAGQRPHQPSPRPAWGREGHNDGWGVDE
jgi:ribosomal protein L11 methyltransferase